MNGWTRGHFKQGLMSKKKGLTYEQKRRSDDKKGGLMTGLVQAGSYGEEKM